MKKNLTISLLVSLFLLSSCYFPINAVQGNGNIVKKEISIPNISEVILKGSGDVYITKGDKPSLFIECDENIINLLDTKISENKVIFDTKESINPSKLVYWVTISNLNEIIIDGSGDVKVNEGFKSDNFKSIIKGSGDIFVKNLSAETFKVLISGSGNVKMSGTSNNTSLEVDGSGDIIMNEMISKRVTASINGSGDMKINVTEYFKAIINGSGDIGYIGNPTTFETKVNGSGDIYKLK